MREIEKKLRRKTNHDNRKGNQRELIIRLITVTRIRKNKKRKNERKVKRSKGMLTTKRKRR